MTQRQSRQLVHGHIRGTPPPRARRTHDRAATAPHAGGYTDRNATHEAEPPARAEAAERPLTEVLGMVVAASIEARLFEARLAVAATAVLLVGA